MINKFTFYVKRYLNIVFRAFSAQIITHFFGRSNENFQCCIHGYLDTFQDVPTNCLDIFSFSNIFTIRKEVAKVMFLHVSVILFTGEGVCSRGVVSALRGGSAPRGWCLLPGCVCLLRGVSAPGGSAPEGGWYPSMHWGRPTPRGEMATAKDGTHPTGMHSCSK